jgi:hypothetical protein
VPPVQTISRVTLFYLLTYGYTILTFLFQALITTIKKRIEKAEDNYLFKLKTDVWPSYLEEENEQV